MVVPEIQKDTSPINSTVQVAEKTDGWKNLLSGAGVRGQDKSLSTHYTPDTVLTDGELYNIFNGEGIARKVITRLADDMTREGFQLSNTASAEKYELVASELDVTNKVNFAIKMARLYRGSIILMVTKNRYEDLSKPRNPASEIVDLRVYTAADIKLNFLGDISADTDDITKLEFIPLEKANGEVITVHNSRVCFFTGEQIATPRNSTITPDYRLWGYSVLQLGWSKLTAFGDIEKSTITLMIEFMIGKFRLSNLETLLATNETDKIYDRIDQIAASKSTIKAVLLGQNEEYTRDFANVSGIDSILQAFQTIIAMVFDYPVALLWGRSPAGMNATGEFDIRNYYDVVHNKQETWLRKPLTKLLSAILPQNADLSFQFKKLWQISDKEKAEILLIHTNILTAAVNAGALTGDDFADILRSQAPELFGDT